LQSEVNVARNKLLFVLGFHTGNTKYYRRKANTALSNCTETCSLQKVIYNM